MEEFHYPSNYLGSIHYAVNHKIVAQRIKKIFGLEDSL